MKRVIRKVLSLEDFRKSAEITAVFVTDRQIQRLNERYLGKNYPTDVLAFDMSIDDKHLSADIIVSTETAIKNAKIFRTSTMYELYLYIIHGVLHLLGYDDRTTTDRTAMDRRATFLLDAIVLKPGI